MVSVGRLFSTREASVFGMNGSVKIGVVRGGSQGSICGPCIWNLMMNSLLGLLEPLCKCCAYADDLLFVLELERAGGQFLEIVNSRCDARQILEADHE